MKSAYSLTFDNQSTAQVIELTAVDEVSAALHSLSMPTPRAALVVVGGANGLTEEYIHQLDMLFSDVLCPFVESHQLAVVDGGTDSGIMRLLGQARAKTKSTFPLLGVVVKGKTFLPGHAPKAEDAAPLEPNHTHFLLVPGQAWGDESAWIAQVADSVSNALPSATLLINGGSIALNQDVPNSVTSQRPVLVMAGSGRAADQLVAALNGSSDNAQLDQLVKSGLIHAVALDEGVAKIQRALTAVFETFTWQPPKSQR